MLKRLILAFFLLALSLSFFSKGDVFAKELGPEDAYQGIVKINTFSPAEGGYLSHFSSGSGVIIDSDGLVLTNHHVVSRESRFDSDLERDVAYQVCLTKEKNETPDCIYSASLVAFDSDKDLALLQIEGVDGLESQKEFPYIKTTYDEVDVEEEIRVLGYPEIGGGTITITQGSVSGKENRDGLDWLKTDADISFGNSGGAAVNNDGELVGVPTQSHASLLASTGYLLEVSAIEDWIESNKNNDPVASKLEDRMLALTKKQQKIAEDDVISFDRPGLEMTKKDNWSFLYNRENRFSILNEESSGMGNISVYWDYFLYDINKEDLDRIFNIENQEIFLFGGRIIRVEDVDIGEEEARMFRLSFFGEVFSFYLLNHKNHVILIEYDYGYNDQGEEAIDQMINSLKLSDFDPGINKADHQSFYNNYHNFGLELGDSDWLVKDLDNLSRPVRVELEEDPEVVVNFLVEKKSSGLRGLTNNDLYGLRLGELEQSLNLLFQDSNYSADILSAKSYLAINEQINDAIIIEFQISDGSDNIFTVLHYYIDTGEELYSIELKYGGLDMEKYERIKESFSKNVLENFTISGYGPRSITEEVLSYKDEEEEGAKEEDDPQDENGDEEESEDGDGQKEEYDKEDAAPEEITINNLDMYDNLRGRIVLKVEDGGKAYYIDPENPRMIFLGRPADAFQVMRQEGLGISSQDLAKIPVSLDYLSGKDSDGDGLPDDLERALGTDPYNTDTSGNGYCDWTEIKHGYDPLKKEGRLPLDEDFSLRQAGRILLQVEDRGEAWYVNPDNNRRHFLGRPADAFELMRNLGLGISNQDFDRLSS